MQERIIGAIILVIFVVLVVPIFLDGPPDDGEVVSERVLLPGQEGQDIKVVVLDRERSEPIPVANSIAPDADAQQADTVETEVPSMTPQREADPIEERESDEASAAPQPKVETPAESTTGMWAVQLGSFSNKENAEKLAGDLRKQGYAAFLSQLQTDAGQLHRVRIGPQKNRESAEAMAARLLKVSHEGQVVPHP